MKRLIALTLLISLGACATIFPTGQRYVVFFGSSESDLDAPAKQVVATAAQWSTDHPAQPVIVASFGDPYGTPQAVAGVNQARAANVTAQLVASGVPAGRIAKRDMGTVQFQFDSQESRRVEITVGAP